MSAGESLTPSDSIQIPVGLLFVGFKFSDGVFSFPIGLGLDDFLPNASELVGRLVPRVWTFYICLVWIFSFRTFGFLGIYVFSPL